MSAAPSPIEPELLLSAYRAGVFPMANAAEDPDVFWVEPRERAIIPLDSFHCSRSLLKLIRQDRFTVRCDTAFAQVVEECAAPRGDDSGSWINQPIRSSYIELHRRGLAHSIECWQEDRLAGGLYGVAFDRVFCGESMFSRVPNSSKVALAWLVAAMKRAGYQLLDCQFMTDHLERMGAVSVSQQGYLKLVRSAGGSPAMPVPQAVEAIYALGPSSPGKLIAQSLTQTS
jgi:leucyl/phenylalanyl-tRNA--protein transferase